MSLFNDTITTLKQFRIQADNTSIGFPSTIGQGHHMSISMIEWRRRLGDSFEETSNSIPARNRNSGAEAPNTVKDIFLYMPASIEFNYGAGWDIIDLNKTGFFTQEYNANKKNIDGSLIDNLTSGSATADDFGQAADIATSALKAVGQASIIAARDGLGFKEKFNTIVAGNIQNPFRDATYTGPVQREFKFNWQLVPESEKDCTTIQDIIKSLKRHSAPKQSSANVSKITVPQFYNFPGEFEIRFLKGVTINDNLPRIGYCVCSDVSTNFTPNGLFSAFRNGHPVQIDLSLSFKEINVITKDLIDQGF